MENEMQTRMEPIVLKSFIAEYGYAEALEIARYAEQCAELARPKDPGFEMIEARIDSGASIQEVSDLATGRKRTPKRPTTESVLLDLDILWRHASPSFRLLTIVAATTFAFCALVGFLRLLLVIS